MNLFYFFALSKRILSISFIFLFSSCVTIIWRQNGEEKQNYIIEKNVKPSYLIEQYLDITLNEHNNYVIVSWESGCIHCSNQINNMNMLFEKYGSEYSFLAINNEKTSRITHVFNKLGIEENYNFSTFNNVWGLRSSLRNLYYKNDLSAQQIDGYPMNFIIKDDQIIHIDASIEREEWANEFEEHLK